MFIMRKYENYLRTQNLEQNTIDTYLLIANQFIAWATHNTGKGFTNELLRGEFLDFKKFLDEERQNAPNSIKLKVIALKRFNKFLTKEHYQRLQVIGKEDNVNTYKSYLEQEIPSDATVELFLKKVDESENLRDMALIRVIIETGMKVSEILSLTVEDYDRSRRMLSVGNLNRRSFLLKRETGLLLDTLLQGQKQKYPMTNSLFLSRRGKAMCRSRVNQIFNKHAEGVTPQLLRHYYCIKQIEQGVPLKQVMNSLGNVSIQFMKKYQIHVGRI